MPFTIEDFQDLLQLLEARPEWRAELRQRVLSQELLDLPALVRRLTEAQERSEQRLERIEAALERLAAAQERGDERLGRVEAIAERLAEAQARSEERLGRLEEGLGRVGVALEHTAASLARLTARLEEHERRNASDFQTLKTDAFARRLT